MMRSVLIREKTKRITRNLKYIRVIVTPEMQDIIDRWGNKKQPDNYIFPLLKKINDPIKQYDHIRYLVKKMIVSMSKIGKELGIGKIGTYTARHSYATVLKRSGANIAYISESLGHSDLRITESYLASFEKEERIKNAQLLTKF